MHLIYSLQRFELFLAQILQRNHFKNIKININQLKQFRMRTLNSISYFALGFLAMIVVYTIIGFQALRQFVKIKR